MNRVCLVGRLVRDVFVAGGGKVAKCTLATSAGWDRKRMEEITAFVPVTMFDLSPKVVEKLKKGQLLAVEGRVERHSYDKKGEKVYTTEVTAAGGGVKLVGTPREREGAENEE